MNENIDAVMLEKKPAGHEVQAPPDVLEKVPRAHWKQVNDPACDDDPTAHGLQDEDPVELEKVHFGQAVQGEAEML
jgi:hypothetical protein